MLACMAVACVGCSDGSGPEEDPPPSVWGFTVGWDGIESKHTGAPTFAAGDTIQFVIHASDNSRVTWLGFELSGLYVGADSVEVTDSLHTVYVDTYVPTGTSAAGTILVTGFAWDDQGQRGEQELKGNPISLYITKVRPFLTFDLDAPVRDIAFDPRRERAFLSQPTESRIAVISTGSAHYLPPLQPPAAPAGIDVTIVGLGTGMLRTRIADGVTTERVYVPEVPQKVYTVPGPRNQVLILSETLITLVELDGPLQMPINQAGPAWSAEFAAVRGWR